MADEAIDHLITKSYDTENLKSTLNEFQLDASKRVKNYRIFLPCVLFSIPLIDCAMIFILGSRSSPKTKLYE